MKKFLLLSFASLIIVNVNSQNQQTENQILTGCTNLTLSTTSMSFSSDIASDSVWTTSPPTNCVWAATASDSWITIDSGSSASSSSGINTLYFSISANTGFSSRTGDIIFTSNGPGAVFTITQSGLVGINESTRESFLEISPNPSSGKFNVTTGINNGKIKIFNILGETVYQTTISQPNSIIDISSEPKGIYFVQLSIGSKNISNKIIIE